MISCKISENGDDNFINILKIFCHIWKILVIYNVHDIISEVIQTVNNLNGLFIYFKIRLWNM
jgi:hypothetical protein